jgi:exopolysaccharide biosynthesis polyprenyl glycosylphosphotransferase
MLHVKHLKRRRYFALLDLSIVFLAAWFTLWVRTHIPLPVFVGFLTSPERFSWASYFLPVAGLGLAYILTLYLLGIYDLWSTVSVTAWIQRLAIPNIFIAGVAFSWLYLIQDFSFPRSLPVLLFGTTFLLSLLWRLLYFHFLSKVVSEIALVGELDDTARFLEECDLPPYQGRLIVRALFVPSQKYRDRDGLKVPVFPLSELRAYTSKHPNLSIVVVPAEQDQQRTFSEVFQAATSGTGVFAIPTAYEILFGHLRYFALNDLPLIELRLDPPSASYSFLKHVFDFLLATLTAVLFAPIALIIAATIKLTSPGPVLFTQERVGLHGKTFRIIKFRSMHHNADAATGPRQATENDPRLTPVGSFLRKTRLDELPQIYNVLLGHMSFVGPRPLHCGEVAAFEAELPWFRERHRVKPGLTGLAQIRGHYATSADTKIKYDLAYLANQSLIMDLQILARTMKIILTKSGQ